MYVDMNNFPEALRVAKKHAPHMVSEITSKYQNSTNSPNMTGEDIYNTARTWEDARDYIKAIDLYLDVKPENTSNQELMKESWERAVHLATQFNREKAPQIV